MQVWIEIKMRRELQKIVSFKKKERKENDQVFGWIAHNVELKNENFFIQNMICSNLRVGGRK